MELLAIFLMVAVGAIYLTKDHAGRLWTDAAALAAFVLIVTTYAVDLLQWALYMTTGTIVVFGREWWRQRKYRRERTVFLRDTTGRDLL